MLPHSEHFLLYWLFRVTSKVFDWLDNIVQYCVRLEARVFFPTVAFEVPPFADCPEPKAKEHLQNMCPAAEMVGVDTQVLRDANKIHSLVRHTAENAPRIRRRPVSSQVRRDGPSASPDASAVSWFRDEKLRGIDVENTPWQDYDIPDELMQVLANTPVEVLNIVRESIDNRRALKVSTSAEASRDSTIPVVDLVNTGDNSAAQSSTTASSQRVVSQVSISTVGSTSRTRTSSPNQAMKSATTLGSNTEGELRNPHHLDVSLQASGSRDTMRRKSPRIDQFKLQKSHPKFFKDHGLSRLFRTRNTTIPELALPATVDSESTPSECASCFEGIPDSGSTSLACQHKYCTDCFLQLIQTSMKNENLFPPKCCLQEIPRATIRIHMPVKDLAQFDEKAQEYAVPVGSRWYCSSPGCGKWIKTGKRPRLGTLACPHCKFSMCTSCRGPRHSLTEDCPEDQGLGATLLEAEREGWRRCYNCRSMVELATGCRHITCKCKAEFCYTCGARWRTCGCTEDDQTRRRIALRATRQVQTAEQRAEDAEVQAAIAAVEAAERQEREENERILMARMAEIEAEQARIGRLMEELESKRRDGITAHYQNLRNALRDLHTSHRKALAKRFESDRHRITRAREVWNSDQQAQAAETEWEKNNVQNKKNIIMGELREKQAKEISEIIARHKVDEDKLSSRLNEEFKSAIPKLDSMERLWEVQRNERAALRMHHTPELHKWQVRFATEIDVVEERPRQQQQKMKNNFLAAIDEVDFARRVFAGRKWYEVLTEEQQGMLDADERHLLDSGADAPNRDAHTVAEEVSAAGSSKQVERKAAESKVPAIRTPYSSFHDGSRMEHSSPSGSTRAFGHAAPSFSERLELQGWHPSSSCIGV